jgi:predicted glycosyltransferase
LIDRVDIEVKVTVREGAGTEKMAKFLGLNFDIIGKHGGKDPYGKLIASIQRMKELAEYAKKLKGYAFYTHSSVEGTRVAYGLGLRPIITSDDTPWSIYVANLIIPLCDYHIMPIWTKGLWSVKHSKNNHPTLVLYDGVKEVEWTKAIELNWKPRYILVREPEVEASYLNYEFKEFHLLAKDFNNVSYAKRYEGFYDIIKLIANSYCVVTLCGSTVGKEACLLGVPTVMYTKGISSMALSVLNYLKDKGLPVYDASSYEELKSLVKRFIQEPVIWDTKDKRKRMESPIDYIDQILKQED